jgi:transposase
MGGCLWGSPAGVSHAAGGWPTPLRVLAPTSRTSMCRLRWVDGASCTPCLWQVVRRLPRRGATATANSKTVGIDVGLTSPIALSTGEPRRPQGACASDRARLADARRVRSGEPRSKFSRPSTRNPSPTSGAITCTSSLGLSSTASAGIAVEDLNIKGLARGMHAKHVNDASWAQLVSMITYKAAKAGGEVIKVIRGAQVRNAPGCGQNRRQDACRSSALL